MNTYRVLVSIKRTFALDVQGIDSNSALKAAQNIHPFSGKRIGDDQVHYEVVDNDFETTN